MKERKKLEADKEELKQNKKRNSALVKELDAKKSKLIEDARMEAELIEREIETLTN